MGGHNDRSPPPGDAPVLDYSLGGGEILGGGGTNALGGGKILGGGNDRMPPPGDAPGAV